MISIKRQSENTLCGECKQPRRNCRCLATGRPQNQNRWQKIKDELDELAAEHPDVLGESFTSKATGQRRKVLLAVRRRYFAVLRELVEVRMWENEPDMPKPYRYVTKPFSLPALHVAIRELLPDL